MFSLVSCVPQRCCVSLNFFLFIIFTSIPSSLKYYVHHMVLLYLRVEGPPHRLCCKKFAWHIYRHPSSLYINNEIAMGPLRLMPAPHCLYIFNQQYISILRLTLWRTTNAETFDWGEWLGYARVYRGLRVAYFIICTIIFELARHM